MERTICDRCGKPINGPLAIVGLWSNDGGFGGRGVSPMNGLPNVTAMSICPECRKEVEDVITHGLPV